MDGEELKGIKVSRAGPGDEQEVQALLQEWGMDLAGKPEGHTVLKVDGVILAAGKIVWLEGDFFHLEMLAVRSEARGRGLGGVLLLELIKKPWVYSHSLFSGGHSRSYHVTTVARGEAAGFYRRYNFRHCRFSDLAPFYRGQCSDCPHRQACHPVPMIIKQEVF